MVSQSTINTIKKRTNESLFASLEYVIKNNQKWNEYYQAMYDELLSRGLGTYLLKYDDYKKTQEKPLVVEIVRDPNIKERHDSGNSINPVSGKNFKFDGKVYYFDEQGNYDDRYFYIEDVNNKKLYRCDIIRFGQVFSICPYLENYEKFGLAKDCRYVGIQNFKTRLEAIKHFLNLINS